MVQLSTLLALAVSTLVVTSKPVAVDVAAAASASASAPVRVSVGTNAERIANGMSPLPPTRRSSALKVRRSSAPGGDENSTARRRYLVRVTDPNGNDMGAISMPGAGSDGNSDDDTSAFNPNTDRSQKFAFGPGSQQGQNFEISPADGDDVFGRRGGLLAALGRGKPADLSKGSPNFANLGMAHEGPDGLLNLNLPLDLGLPSSLLGLTNGGGDNDGDAFGKPNRLLGLTHGTPLDGATDGLTSPGGLDLGLLDGLLGDLSLVDVAVGPVKQLLADPSSINSVGSPQSAIWTFDPATRRLYARYINSNGEVVPTQFVTGGACPHLICLTADVTAFRGFWGNDASEIFLSAGLL